MDILLISNEDMCRSRIAQELFTSFGRGMKIFTAGITEGSSVPQVVCDVMQHHGYEVSRKKPSSVSIYTNRPWDYVLTLSKEAEEEYKYMNLQTQDVSHLHFEDALQHATLDADEIEEQVEALYADMYHNLYEFYRDELSERLMPRCTCGANTYCRCE